MTLTNNIEVRLTEKGYDAATIRKLLKRPPTSEEFYSNLSEVVSAVKSVNKRLMALERKIEGKATGDRQ